jgi:type IV pilus assembly protein PilB
LFQRGSRLFIGLSDPNYQQAITEIRFQSGLSVEPVVVEWDKLELAIDRFFHDDEEDLSEALGDLDDTSLEDIDISSPDDEQDDDDFGAGRSEAEEAPIVRFINKILLDAIRLGASDVHFEPYEKNYRIRLRIDGILQEVTKPPANLAARISARLKVMARLDISERRLPQDGRIKLRLSKNRAIDFRMNTLPTLFGEKIVLRILDSSAAKVGIEALGFDPVQREQYENALSRSQGMILVTGPTGSGKTVTLYTGLGILNDTVRNISTAEDPVEINMPGVNQVHVNARVGLTFAEALRSFLRQDPDVVMVGEIRDLETADIAIKASQTGHLVLSTLHTNSAPESITRLLNMGVATFNVATSVSLIMAQRLTRMLCTQCKEPIELPDNILEEEGFFAAGIAKEDIHLHKAVGCHHCNKGYKGRTGVFEVLPVTDELSACILREGTVLEMEKIAAEQGVKNLRQSALHKVAAGIISMDEANRVTKE